MVGARRMYLRTSTRVRPAQAPTMAQPSFQPSEIPSLVMSCPTTMGKTVAAKTVEKFQTPKTNVEPMTPPYSRLRKGR